MSHGHHHFDTQTKPKNSYTIGVILLTGFIGLIILKNVAQGIPTSQVPSILTDGITIALGVFIGAFPFVILGVLFSVVAQVFIPDRWIDKLSDAHPVIRRIVLTFAGMTFPVCECGNIPVSRTLIAKGFSVGDSTTFLLSAPIINPITITTTAVAFGWTSDVLFGRVLGGIIIANLVGVALSMFRNQSSLLRRDFVEYCEMQHAHVITNKRTASFEKFFAELSMLLPAVIIAAVIAALIQTIVPVEVISAIGDSPILGVLVMMLLAFVISICSNVDSFFALSLSSSFSSGALTSFLTFGAMVDIKMIALMRTTYSVKGIAVIVAIAAIGSAVLGWVVNAI